MTFNPKEYGIDISDPVGALTTARKQYVTTVEHLKASRDDGRTKELFTQWRDAGLPKVHIPDIESEDGPTLLAYADLFSELAKQYRSYADTEAKESLGMVLGGDIREDKRETAEQLRKVVEALFGMLNPMGLVPEEFPVKTGKNGDILPDLPKNAHKPHNK